MHTECAGLDKVPRGKWYCPEHAASLGKSSKAKPSSAKSSANLDSTALAPSNSGKLAAAGASAPSKAGPDSKAAAGGKAGRAHSEDDSADGQAPKKARKAGKGKVLGEEDTTEGSVPKKGGGKAGKNEVAAEQTDPLPKAPSKTTIKLKTGGSSKASKARPDAASAAADASVGKPSGGDVPASADRPANGNGAKAKSNKGKETARKRSADDKTLHKGTISHCTEKLNVAHVKSNHDKDSMTVPLVITDGMQELGVQPLKQTRKHLRASSRLLISARRAVSKSNSRD